MRTLNLSLAAESPKYLAVAGALRRAIRAGTLKPGEKVPSTRHLAWELQINRHTVMAALQELVAEGWLQSSERRSYRVAADLPSSFERNPSRSLLRAEAPFPVYLENPLPKGTLNQPGWDFRSGRADFRLFPFQELKSHWQDSLKRRGGALLDYASPEGHPGFIEGLCEYLRRVRGLTTGRRLIVTHGSQEAIFITAQVLLRPNDLVIVEQLNYSAARMALASTGAELVPVPIDREGMDPDALAKVLERRRCKLIYLTPLHQYPTTVTLSVPRRLAIYALAAKHRVAILEDDYDHEYHYRCQPLPPLAADDPEGLVIYVSSFSKILYPSARIGFVVVPEELRAAFVAFRHIISGHNDTLVQDALARWMQAGDFERHLNRTRRVYHARRDALLGTLENLRGKTGVDLSWIVPDGGMALWLKTPWDTLKLTKAAEKSRIMLQPEEPTRMDGKTGTHFRLGFTRQTPEETQAGLHKLLELAKHS